MATSLADTFYVRFGGNERKDFWGDQVIVEDDVCRGKDRRCPDCQEFRIARAGAYEVDAPTQDYPVHAVTFVMRAAFLRSRHSSR